MKLFDSLFDFLLVLTWRLTYGKGSNLTWSVCTRTDITIVIWFCITHTIISLVLCTGVLSWWFGVRIRILLLWTEGVFCPGAKEIIYWSIMIGGNSAGDCLRLTINSAPCQVSFVRMYGFSLKYDIFLNCIIMCSKILICLSLRTALVWHHKGNSYSLFFSTFIRARHSIYMI